jgi:CheY-like chemotaxis protein/nitrogen-specific signal transduction histidine kinase
MVVEHEGSTRAALTLLIEAEGHSVVSCPSAARALGFLREGAAPDLIVLDLLMPEMDGWEFRVQQKREPKWASIPVIAISSDSSAKAEAIDAAAYLQKPIADQLFVETIRRVARDLLESRAVARDSEFQRLVSLGSLIGGIAHEINNPLAFVEGSLELLQRQLVALAGPGRTLEPLGLANALRALERTKVGVKRITDVVRCVSMFAWADPSIDAAIDVHQSLESSLQVAANEIRHCAMLERRYQAVARVKGNPAKLGQVFLNLILNAVFEINESGLDNQLIRVSTAQEGPNVVITVEDTATVHDRLSVKSMFDPLATLASGKMGRNFGLAVSRELVEALGGTIEVRCNQASGVSFRVLLPRVSEEVYPAPVRPSVLGVTAKRCGIAVIDDDELMCEVLASLLSEDYEVVSFSSPHAALAAALDGTFDLILCDVMMPELNGIELYERLVRERPELASRFVFLTGGAFTERARLFLRATDRPTLQKPFSRQALLKVIESTLAAAQRNGAPHVTR